jgi:hypothetical protein
MIRVWASDIGFVVISRIEVHPIPMVILLAAFCVRRQHLPLLDGHTLFFFERI